MEENMSNTATNTDNYLCGIDAEGKLAASYILYSRKDDEISELTDKIHSINSALTAVQLDSETYNQLIGNRGKEYRYKDGAAVEYIPPEPTPEEVAEQEAAETANKARQELDTITTKAMRNSLAGGGIATLSLSYQQTLAAVPDAAALKMPEYFQEWDGAGHDYGVGDRVTFSGTLYKCLQSHTSQEAWTPTDAPSLWAQVLITGTEDTPPEWEQPDSTNPYMTGDRVTYNGKVYESTVDNNVWSPANYPEGWKEVAD